MIISTCRVFRAVAVAAILLPSSTIAQEARDFADKLSASIKSFTSIDIEFGSAVSEGDNIVLSDWNIEGLEGSGSRAEKILDGTLTFVGVSPTADGGYRAEQAIFSDIDFSDDGIRLEVRDVVVNNIEIFADPDGDILRSMQFYRAIKAGPVRVTMGDREVFRIDEFFSDFVPNKQLSEFSGGYSISGIYGDLSQIDDSDMDDGLKMFDLTEINANMGGDVFWDTKTGLLSFKNSYINIQGMGELIVNADILGYTLELARVMQDQGKAMQEMDPTSSQAEMAGMQFLMSTAEQLSISDISIRFNDDSLTNNLLNFMAADQGVSRKGFVSMAISVLPSALESLGMPALQDQIIEATTSFLTNPVNIEIMAKPAEPVPFMALFSAAQNPSIANELLNISVIANQ